ncbi:hypothetical protein GCM10023189_38820 [Nibrella saemangeumensis]|uniref:HTH LytTR-type domain-containing protein n=1 Tax=Nibrella saemangeumensis TaxID=1084526 RepID=A0ABP8NB00_9BACT
MEKPLYTYQFTTAGLEEISRHFHMSELTLPFWGYRKKMPMYRIMRLEGEGNYTRFHFNDGSELVVSLTLKKMEARLPPLLFVRLHKKNIINLMYLNDVRYDNQQVTVVLANGDRVEVSRRKTNLVMKQIQDFQQEIRALSGMPLVATA